jgi:hypothetical protein
VTFARVPLTRRTTVAGTTGTALAGTTRTTVAGTVRAIAVATLGRPALLARTTVSRPGRT